MVLRRLNVGARWWAFVGAGAVAVGKGCQRSQILVLGPRRSPRTILEGNVCALTWKQAALRFLARDGSQHGCLRSSQLSLANHRPTSCSLVPDSRANFIVPQRVFARISDGV